MTLLNLNHIINFKYKRGRHYRKMRVCFFLVCFFSETLKVIQRNVFILARQSTYQRNMSLYDLISTLLRAEEYRTLGIEYQCSSVDYTSIIIPHISRLQNTAIFTSFFLR